MALFGVQSLDDMRSVGQQCQTASENIYNSLNQQAMAVQNLIDDGASGTDIVQLQQVETDFMTAATKLKTVLSTIGSALVNTANNYESNMHTNAANISSVGASLPAGNF
jgi:hypothetical protein